MYQKILIPLDKTKDSAAVLPRIQRLVDPGGEVILLHIIPLGLGTTTGYGAGSDAQRRRQEQMQAMAYLEGIVAGIEENQERYRCVVEASKSPSNGIVDCAAKENADLIAMLTHDRKGLSKLLKGSVAEKVKRLASMEVLVVKPSDLN